MAEAAPGGRVRLGERIAKFNGPLEDVPSSNLTVGGKTVTVLEILVALLLLIGTAVVLHALAAFDALAAPPAAPESRSEASGAVRRRAA